MDSPSHCVAPSMGRAGRMKLRHIVVAIAAACLAVSGLVAAAHPAAAVQTVGFTADSGVSRVTGTIVWTDSEHFSLEDVTLYDTSCDNRSAEFWTTTNLGDLATHVNSRGCNTSTFYSELDASGGPGSFDWIEIKTNACNFGSCSSTGFSGIKDNPY
jgi:hypothetical protein